MLTIVYQVLIGDHSCFHVVKLSPFYGERELLYMLKEDMWYIIYSKDIIKTEGALGDIRREGHRCKKCQKKNTKIPKKKENSLMFLI